MWKLPASGYGSAILVSMNPQPRPRQKAVASAIRNADPSKVRNGSRFESSIEEKIMWPELTTEDAVRTGLSIANGVKHPEWNGVDLPSKDAIAYLKALQGPGGPLFGRLLARTMDNHTKLFFKDARICNPYADLLEWWRRFLLEKKRAMVLPFPLEDAGEPFLTPPDQRFVQKLGGLYVYGSSKYPDAKPNTYIRKK